MKILNIVFALLLTLHSYTSNAQLSFEAIGGLGMNMSIKTKYRSIPKGPISTTDTHFPGGNFEVGFGARMQFSKRWSFGLAVAYHYKGNEANFLQEPTYPENVKFQFHLMAFPVDISYTFANKIGLHLGAEIATLLTPRTQGSYLSYQDKVMVGALTGISYTKGRFRFELLYKHYFNHYMKQTIYFNMGPNEPYAENTDFNRFHDIQFRVAVRLFSVN